MTTQLSNEEHRDTRPRAVDRAGEPQEIMTSDKSNACADNHHYQMAGLARTTLRTIIVTMTLMSANGERGRMNRAFHQTVRDGTAMGESTPGFRRTRSR